jgi:hypothetical protein
MATVHIDPEVYFGILRAAKDRANRWTLDQLKRASQQASA